MAGSDTIRIETYGGANLRCRFPAVVAVFEPVTRQPLDLGSARGVLARELPALGLALDEALGARSAGAISVPELAAAIAAALQNHAEALVDHWSGSDPGQGPAIACVGYRHPTSATDALRLAIGLVALFARRAPVPEGTWQRVRATVEAYRAAAVNRHPDRLTRALLAAARERGIPVYEPSPASRVYQYGQGMLGWQGFEGSSEWDSLTGGRLAGDKRLSNAFARRLGLPHTRQRVARDADEAVEAARAIGYPCVVKPPDGAKGRGITVGVTDDEAVRRAFALARRHTERPVVVEGQVAGADHRLTVLSGRMVRAIRRDPPQVAGDGRRSLRELVQAENGRRAQQVREDTYLVQIPIDTTLEAIVGQQGHALDDILAVGETVRLRLNANISTGAVLVDVRDRVHPDVEAMAIAYANALRLDAAGIDYITEDISRSWRETESAIIEVNKTPGFADPSAPLFLGRRFGDGDDGRVPTLVVVDAREKAPLANAIRDRAKAGGAVVGLVTPEATVAGDFALGFARGTALHERVLGLVLQPCVEALVIGCSPAEIERSGFPLDRCDRVAVVDGTEVSAPLRELLAGCAGELRTVGPDEADEAALAAALTAGRRAPVRQPGWGWTG